MALETLVLSLKHTEKGPVNVLRTASGRIVAHVFDEKYLYPFIDSVIGQTRVVSEEE